MTNQDAYNKNIAKLHIINSKIEHLKSGRDLFDDPKEFWSQLKVYNEQLTDCAIEHHRLIKSL